MGLPTWATQRRPGPRGTLLPSDLCDWQLAGPLAARTPLPSPPPRLPSPDEPAHPKRRQRQSPGRRGPRNVLGWLQDLSPRPTRPGRVRPLGAEPALPPDFREVAAHAPVQPSTRPSWYERYVRRKEAGVQQQQQRRTAEAALPPAEGRPARLQPLPGHIVRALPPPPPQPANTPTRSAAADSREDSRSSGACEPHLHSPYGGTASVWDPRRHYLEAHLRAVRRCRAEERASSLCDLRDPNDSPAYRDVAAYILENGLLSRGKLRSIRRWLDASAEWPGFVYSDRKEWFLPADSDLGRCSSTQSSVSAPGRGL